MGTRGIIGFIMPDGAVKGSYNQYDMYPDGVGKDIQTELREMNAPLKSMLPDVERIRWVDASETPSDEDRAYLKELGINPQNVSVGTDWYAALRDHHGSMRKRVRLGIATSEPDFLKDSLFCEWAYLIDFRTDEVVILQGFNMARDKEAAYCKAEPNVYGYVGCREAFRGSLDDFLALNLDTFDESVTVNETI